MTRLSQLAKIGLAGLAAAFIATGAAAATLKPYAQVEGSQIRLHHVLDNVETAGDVVVRAAPAPGDDVVISAGTIVRLAKANGIPLAKASGISRVRVERPGVAVSQDDIADLVMESLRMDGVRGDYEVSLSNSRLRVAVPVGSEFTDLQLEDLRFNERTGRFSASLITPVGQGRTARTGISGKAMRMQEVPVLAASLSPGETIRRNDLEWVRKPARRVNRHAVLTMDSLLGMSLRRRVRAGQPLRSSDVEKPRVVERGQTVAMVFERGRMTLTATGKALQAGGRGEMIRLQNVATHRVVEGVIVGPNRVTIGAPAPVQTARR